MAPWIVPVLAILVGFVALLWSADRLVIGASSTARGLGVSPRIIGLTIVAFGTSAPELVVSTIAAFEGNIGLSVGNAIGSNIINVALVLGVAALIQPLTVAPDLPRRDIPILLIAVIVAYALMWDGRLGRFDGIVLFAGMSWMIYDQVSSGLRERRESLPPGAQSIAPSSVSLASAVAPRMGVSRALVWLIVGLVVLTLSSRLLVWGADHLARLFEVSDLIIGLTVVALGTSLPELAASVASALRGEHDIALGNVVGSNIFNIFAVLGVPALFAPGHFDRICILRDFPVMLGLTLMLLVFTWRRMDTKGQLSRRSALIFLSCFLAYTGFLMTNPSVSVEFVQDLG